MKNRVSAAALAVALVTSSAAIAAPRDHTLNTLESPGAYFHCESPHPGPPAFRIGPCWLDSVRGGPN